jgi:hypothetical protein
MFFTVASRVIRHILVDHARRDMAAKRDHHNKAPLEEALTSTSARKVRVPAVLAVEECLPLLAAKFERRGKCLLHFVPQWQVHSMASPLCAGREKDYEPQMNADERR